MLSSLCVCVSPPIHRLGLAKNYARLYACRHGLVTMWMLQICEQHSGTFTFTISYDSYAIVVALYSNLYVLYIFSAVHIVTSTVDTAECALISHRHAVASTESLALHCAVAVHSCDDCIPSQCIPMQCMTAWMALHEHRVVVDEWLSNILPNFLVHARHPHTHTLPSPHPPGKPCNKYIGIALHWMAVWFTPRV